MSQVDTVIFVVLLWYPKPTSKPSFFFQKPSVAET